MINLHIKVELLIFICSTDMMRAQNLKMGHMSGS